MQEVEDLAQDSGAGPVAQKAPFALLEDETLVAQCIEMVRQRRGRNVQLLLDFTDYQSSGMSSE